MAPVLTVSLYALIEGTIETAAMLTFKQVFFFIASVMLHLGDTCLYLQL